jgi:hypothetical protein
MEKREELKKVMDDPAKKEREAIMTGIFQGIIIKIKS